MAICEIAFGIFGGSLQDHTPWPQKCLRFLGPLKAMLCMANGALVLLYFSLGTCSLEARSTPFITITPLPRPPESLYSPSTLLGAQDLHHKQHRFLGQALAQAPGVTWTPSGIEGSPASIRIRGGSDSHTLVLWDGIPVNFPSTTSNFFNFGCVGTGGVGTLSLLSGTQSLLYGSPALGGVVLIETPSGQGDPSLLLVQEGGSARFMNSRFCAQGQQHRFSYAVQGETFRVGTGALWNAKHQVRQSDDFHSCQGSVKVNLPLTPDFHCTGYVRTQNSETKNNQILRHQGKMIPVESPQDKTHQTWDFAYIRGRWEPKKAWHHVTTLSWMNVSQNTVSGGAPSVDQGTRERFHHLLTHEIDPKNRFQGAIESEGETQKRDHQKRNHVTQTHGVGIYHWRPLEFLILGGGGRITHHARYKTHWTSQFSMKMFWKSTRIFSSWGTGFRSPSLFELYGSNSPDFRVFPNPSLRPEKSHSFEVGGEYRFSPWAPLKLRMTGFDLGINRIIQYDFASQRYENKIHRHTQGIEAKLWFFPTSWFQGTLGYTVIKGKDSDTHQQPLKIPVHKVDASVSCTVKSCWHWFMDATYTSDSKGYAGTKLGENFLVRTGMAYTPHPRVRFFMRIENLFNRSYEFTPGYAGRSRGFYVGVAYIANPNKSQDF